MHYAQTDERPNRSPNPKHGTSPLLLGQWAHHPAHARLAGAAQSLARPVQARDDVASRPAECVAAAHTPRASQARGEHRRHLLPLGAHRAGGPRRHRDPDGLHLAGERRGFVSVPQRLLLGAKQSGFSRATRGIVRAGASFGADAHARAWLARTSHARDMHMRASPPPRRWLLSSPPPAATHEPRRRPRPPR